MPYDFSKIPQEIKVALKKRVAERYPWSGLGRGYEKPELVITALYEDHFRLAARIQYEGGARAEGVGFPRSPFSKSCIDSSNLYGIQEDDYFRNGKMVGVIKTTEKGGFESFHYIRPKTYRELEEHLAVNGQLKGSYSEYLHVLNDAAKATGQYRSGRGTHSLKHNFAYDFLEEALAAGKSHASAMSELSKRCAHHRADVVVIHYAARR